MRIDIAEGSKLLAAGTGMKGVTSGQIDIDVSDGATVEQVLLYWAGRGHAPDNEIMVNGTQVVGTSLGNDAEADAFGYRADITKLRLVSAGSNQLNITEMEFGDVPGWNDGVSVLVIIKDGPDKLIEIRDGLDYAWWPESGEKNVTTKQTFTFYPASIARNADLILVLGDGTEDRPDRVEISIGGTTTSYVDQLNATDGLEWDTINRTIVIPAEETEVSIQFFSDDDLTDATNSDSLSWVAAALSISPSVGGRMTGGGSIFNANSKTSYRVTHGFEIHCDLSKPNNLQVNWPGYRFHMLDLTSALCTDDENIIQKPPKAPLDTFFGIGTGRLNGVDGARIEFTFVDAGEPGTKDTALIQIWSSSDELVLEVSGNINKGNQQAHFDNK